MATSAPQLSPTAPPPEARAPDGLTLYAIGDVHGRADLLKQMIEQVRSDRAGAQDRAELIFLGDYIDRGPASYAVIDQILHLREEADFRVTTLKGNHESVALQFLTNPAVGQFWCQIGGRATLLSYGITAPAGGADIEDWEAVRQAFQAALPEAHLDFLQRLDLHVERGDYLFVHAGLNPRVAFAEQREWDMLWIRDDFLDHPGGFGKVIVHGHTPEDEPFVGPHRIGLDTGADVTGRLTGIKLVAAEHRLISVSNAVVRHSRPAKRDSLGTTRLPPEPPPAAIRPAPATGVPPIAKRYSAWTPARVSALSAGIVALGALTYLAAPLTSSEPVSGPEPGTDRPGAPADIDGLIAQTDKAILAAQKTRELAAASMHPLAGKTPNRGKETTGAPRPESRQPPPAASQAQPARSPGKAPPAAVAAPPSRASDAAPAAAQVAARAPATKPPGTKPLPIADAAPKAAPPAAKPPEHSRAADRAKAPPPFRAPATGFDGGAALAARSATSVRSPAAAAKGIADAADGSENARLTGETALAVRDPMRAAGDGREGSIAGTQTMAYVGSEPVKGANRIRQDDYPNASIEAGEEGVVGVRYVVAANGRVTSCATTQPSKFARLDKQTCEVIRRRFRFKPAVRNGQPVEEVRVQRIRWALCGADGGLGGSVRRDQQDDESCPT